MKGLKGYIARIGTCFGMSVWVVLAFVLGGCRTAEPDLPKVTFGGKVGHVRLANLTDCDVDVIIEDKPYPTLAPGTATVYIPRHDASATVRISGDGEPWNPMSIPPKADVCRTMYVLGSGKRIVSAGDPVVGKVGSAGIVEVNGCAEPVRFHWRELASQTNRKASLAALSSSKPAYLKPGEYELVAALGTGRRVTRRVTVAAGKGYSAAAFLVDGRPRIAWLKNDMDARSESNGAFQCGPLIV